MAYLETLKSEHIDGFEVFYQYGYDEFFTINDLVDDYEFELSSERIDGSSYKIGAGNRYNSELWATPRRKGEEYEKENVQALRDFYSGRDQAYILHCTIRKNNITLVERYGVGGCIYSRFDEQELLNSGYFECLIQDCLEEARNIIKQLCA